MTLKSYAGDRLALWNGDCLALLRDMPDDSVDSIVTDPPYGLGFMGKAWDALPPGAVWAAECLRVLKPGGHLLAFGGSRTWHRLAVAVEDGGFEIRDSIAWLYGSGFPKSHDVSKGIDKAAGATREVVGQLRQPAGNKPGGASLNMSVVGMPATAAVTAAATPEAQQWEGWGTALKPAFEPIVVGRKPLVGTVAANVLEHGTGALNIDGCRIEHASEADRRESEAKNRHADFGTEPGQNQVYGDYSQTPVKNYTAASGGRWPANAVLDEGQAAVLDAQSGISKDGVAVNRRRDPGATKGTIGIGRQKVGSTADVGYGGSGGASRFFYVAKAPKSERVVVNGLAHPTVKPLALMRWLCRLVTPPGGLVLDPFAGSGTTGEAALLEGFRVLLADDPELDDDYTPLIEARVARFLATQE